MAKKPQVVPAAVLIGVALAAAAPARAQVIEVGDDGSTVTYAKPTLFIAGADDRNLGPSISVREPSVDRFERAARSEGIDVQLLRAVAHAESRGRQEAVSPKGALGIMQLMPGTAAELGVDPRDPDANVNGGARYLARQLSRFQSVPLALAAYNAGPGAVLRWGGIPPYAETQAYVATILSRWQGQTGPAKPVSRQRRVPAPVVALLNPLLIEVPTL